MSSSLAAVVLAHEDPAKVRRLIAALDGVDIFLHCDRKVPEGRVRQMVDGAGRHVRLVPRVRTSLYSWSLVDAELAGLQRALEVSPAEHIIVLSGSCYPLVDMGELEEELSHWRGLSRLQLDPVPYRHWDTQRHPDGGLWRFRRRFVNIRGRTLFVRGVPLRTFRRAIPQELRLHASSQWKIYARHHAAMALRILSERTDLLHFWRTTFVPDESWAASILQSPRLVGPIVEQVRDDLPWYIKWGTAAGTYHPAWLTDEDFPALRAARMASPRRPDLVQAGSADRDQYRKLFARKLSSRQEPLLDLIDRALRA
jgi:core-2/I-Branching enzyme